MVAVLSGRGADDVAARVGIPGLGYLGNHGREAPAAAGSNPRWVTAAALGPDRAEDIARAAAIAGRATAALGAPSWLRVDRKGAGLAFHYRTAPDPAGARRAIHHALDRVAPPPDVPDLERLDGRRVVELRPQGAGKGHALDRLVAATGATSVLVLGDDRTDVEAFAAARAARAAGRIADGVIVAVAGGSETPPEVTRDADLVLPSPQAAGAWLERLARRLA